MDLQIWTRLNACFCSSCSINEWDDSEYTDTVYTLDRVTLGTDFKGVSKIYHLEDDQTHILRTMITYRISYKQVQKSKLVVPK